MRLTSAGPYPSGVLARGGTASLVVAFTAVSLLQAVGAAPSSAASSVTLPANADTFVKENHPTTAFGNWMTFAVNGAPERRAYLRFVVPSSAGTVTSATLRVYSVDGSVDGGTVYRVAA